MAAALDRTETLDTNWTLCDSERARRSPRRSHKMGSQRTPIPASCQVRGRSSEEHRACVVGGMHCVIQGVRGSNPLSSTKSAGQRPRRDPEHRSLTWPSATYGTYRSGLGLGLADLGPPSACWADRRTPAGMETTVMSATPCGTTPSPATRSSRSRRLISRHEEGPRRRGPEEELVLPLQRHSHHDRARGLHLRPTQGPGQLRDGARGCTENARLSPVQRSTRRRPALPGRGRRGFR